MAIWRIILQIALLGFNNGLHMHIGDERNKSMICSSFIYLFYLCIYWFDYLGEYWHHILSIGKKKKLEKYKTWLTEQG